MLEILLAWVVGHLLADADAGAWKRLKTFVTGDPATNALAETLAAAIQISAMNIADGDRAASVRIRQGIDGAFEYWEDNLGPSGEISTGDAEATCLGEIRGSIEYTLVNSGLMSRSGFSTQTQLERLAPGVPIETIIDTLIHQFVIEVKRNATRADSPLANLSSQLNDDETHEQLDIIMRVSTDTGGTTVATLAELRHLIQMVASLQETAQVAPSIAVGRARTMFEAMKVIHRDYLTSFASAEAMIRDGVGTRDLLAFLENRRANLAAERCEQTAYAGVLFGTQSGKNGSPDALTEFSEAVLEYFSASNQATRITHYTHFINHLRWRLEQAELAGSEGPQDISDFKSIVTGGSKLLLGSLADSRTKLDDGFARISEAAARL